MPTFYQHCTKLYRDQAGAIITIEMLLVSTVAAIGMLAGLATSRDAAVSELSDVAGAFQDINQSFNLNGIVARSSRTHGAAYEDGLDFCDSINDPLGAADNCITFDGLPEDPVDEEEPSFLPSDIGTFDFDDVVTGVGGSAEGTIGDGTIDTGFTVTTDTGNIPGTSNGNEVRFRETVGTAGTFTITYDEPLTEFEFWVRNFANVAGRPEHLLGNFTITLSDGSVINNAAFVILPDAISPNQNYGLFSTRNNDNSRVVSVNRGGADYITDPLYNGSGDQASGRLVFPDIPTTANPAAAGSIGVSSISFERSGGPGGGYQATFSTSGRVLRPGP